MKCNHCGEEIESREPCVELVKGDMGMLSEGVREYYHDRFRKDETESSCFWEEMESRF